MRRSNQRFYHGFMALRAFCSYQGTSPSDDSLLFTVINTRPVSCNIVVDKVLGATGCHFRQRFHRPCARPDWYPPQGPRTCLCHRGDRLDRCSLCQDLLMQFRIARAINFYRLVIPFDLVPWMCELILGVGGL